MSSMYYRVYPAQEQATTFGFRKVEEREMTDILRRVTRPTYVTRVHRDEPKTLHNFRFSPEIRQRTPSACSKRPTSGTPRPKSPRRLTDRELQRLVRRLQKPTLSFEAATAALYNEELVFLDENSYMAAPPSRARSADDRARAFSKLTQSTKASRNKHVFYDQARKMEKDMNNKNKKKPWELPPQPFPTLEDEESEKEDEEAESEQDYVDWERAASPVEVEAITDRVRVPTVASERGLAWCRRSPQRLDEVAMRRKVPLVSGLARTRRVEDISRRLHEGGSPRRGLRPEATRLCYV